MTNRNAKPNVIMVETMRAIIIAWPESRTLSSSEATAHDIAIAASPRSHGKIERVPAQVSPSKVCPNHAGNKRRTADHTPRTHASAASTRSSIRRRCEGVRVFRRPSMYKSNVDSIRLIGASNVLAPRRLPASPTEKATETRRLSRSVPLVLTIATRAADSRAPRLGTSVVCS